MLPAAGSWRLAWLASCTCNRSGLLEKLAEPRHMELCLNANNDYDDAHQLISCSPPHRSAHRRLAGCTLAHPVHGDRTALTCFLPVPGAAHVKLCELVHAVVMLVTGKDRVYSRITCRPPLWQ